MSPSKSHIVLAVLLVGLLSCVAQARTVSHQVGEPTAVSLRNADFKVIDAFVRGEHSELANAKTVRATVQQVNGQLYAILYAGPTNFYDAVVLHNTRNVAVNTIESFKVRSRDA